MDYNEIVNTITATILKQVKKALDTRSHSDKTFKDHRTIRPGKISDPVLPKLLYRIVHHPL